MIQFRIVPIILSSLLFLTFLPTQSAIAVYGGLEALGSERVVGIMSSEDSKKPGCSGALLTERIVLTAAHCLGKVGKHPGILSKEHWEYWVSQPGVDTTKDDFGTRVQSLYVVITERYTNSYDPNSGDYLTTVDDIGFIFLSEPIKLKIYPQIASEAEVLLLKTQRANITHYGYGLSDKGVQTGSPKKVDLKIRPRERVYELNNIVRENYSIITDETGINALCGGDSGGPGYAELNGRLLIVSSLVGASGCGGAGSGYGGTFGTLVHQYETLLATKWEYFVNNEIEIRGWESKFALEKEFRIESAKNNGQYYREVTACHSNGIIAQLQSNKTGEWRDVANVEGWISLNANCYQPWTIYKAAKGESLRWRLASQGQWEVFTAPIAETTSFREEALAAAELKTKQEAEALAAADLKAKQEAETKTAAELKAKQEAEALATAELKAKRKAEARAAELAAAKKVITITCDKGKLTKKVTAMKPVCPSGYKKK